MKAAAERALRFTSAPVFQDYLLGGPITNVTEDVIRNNADTIYHPVGTTSMSPAGASWGVVDPDLLLKGTKGVRIVDAGVLVRLCVQQKNYIVDCSL